MTARPGSCSGWLAEADAGCEGAPAQALQLGTVAEGLQQGDCLVVVVLDLDLDAADVRAPLAVPEHLIPGGLDVDQEVVDGCDPAEGGQQVSGVDGVDGVDVPRT